MCRVFKALGRGGEMSRERTENFRGGWDEANEMSWRKVEGREGLNKSLINVMVSVQLQLEQFKIGYKHCGVTI